MKYVSILKWKAAELTALTETDTGLRDKLCPLAEIVLPGVNPILDKEKKTRKSEEQMHQEMVLKLKNERVAQIPKEFKTAWEGGSIYLDVTLIHDEDQTTELKCFTLKKITEGCSSQNVKIIPVVNMADSIEILTTVKELVTSDNANEVCVRVTSAGLKDTELDSKLNKVIDAVGLARNQVHLLIDLKYLEPSEMNYKSLFDAAQSIAKLKEYKEFIFAAGAFPVDVSKFNSDNNPCYTPRLDWNGWVENVARKDLVRVPTYGDYAMRHPYYSESLQFKESTSTLKYTTKTDWMIFKGQRRNYGAYLANASELVKLQEFKDNTNNKLGDFSYGDKYIVDKANHFPKYAEDTSIKGTGRNQDWIAAGINHHTALVIHQLSNLDG